MSSRLTLSLAGAVAVAALAACGGSGGDGSVDAAVTSSGTMRLSLTDAPSCGAELHVFGVYETHSNHSGGSHPAAARAGVRALSSHQHADGGWGSRGASSLQESAYAVLALNTQRGSSSWDAPAEATWRRARAFLARHFDERRRLPERLWIHKELYTPIRIDRAFLLSALLLALEPDAPARQHLPLEHRPVRYGA